MSTRLDALFRFSQDALNLRAYRQQLLASNIANADTPGYQARDMDFAAALREATGAATPAQQLSATRAGHLSPAAGAGGEAGLKYATPSQTNLDSNSVDMDRERAAFADNAVHYEATLRFINGGVRTLLSAITGQ